MLAGEPYLADDPELVEESLRALTLLEQFNATPVRDAGARTAILHQLLGALGPGSEIRPPLRCDYGYNLCIGARTFVNFGLVALDCAPITIGDDVQIGPNVQLLTPTHPVEPDPRRAKLEAASPIVIGDNVWLGGGALVGRGSASAAIPWWAPGRWSPGIAGKRGGSGQPCSHPAPKPKDNRGPCTRFRFI